MSISTPTYAEPEFSGTAINTAANPGVAAALARARQIQQSVFMQHPEWAALYDEIDPFSAPQADLVELMESAPTAEAVMLIYGFFQARVEISAMTGRPFK